MGPLLRLGAVHEERGDGALRQARIHAEREVRGGGELLHDGVEGRRQAHAAELDGRRKADPAAGDIGGVGLLEALRRGHGAVLGAVAALAVAGRVEGLEHLLADLARLLEDRPHRVGSVASSKPGRLL